MGRERLVRVFPGQRGRFRRVGPLGNHAVGALHDVDHLGDRAIPAVEHRLFRPLPRHAAALDQELRRFRLQHVERLVQVLVVAHRDPVGRRFDARPLQRLALEHVHGDVQLFEGRLHRGQIHLAVALAGVGVARPQQGAAHEHGHVQRRALAHLADVQVPRETTRRHRTVTARLGGASAARPARCTVRRTGSARPGTPGGTGRTCRVC